MSPIAHVDNTRDDVPILLCIGEKDDPIPRTQGAEKEREDDDVQGRLSSVKFRRSCESYFQGDQRAV